MGRARSLVAFVVSLALAPAAAEAQSGPVLVVGDSLEVGTGPHLRRELASVPITIDARTGRPSSEGVRVLRERLRPSHEVVVFDLGTNDDPAQTASLARNLATVRERAGDRCLVVSTVTRPPVNGVSVAGMNRTVRDFVDATADVRLVDWEAATRRDPAMLAADDVHATPAGYAARARLVAAAIEECFGAVDPPATPRRKAPEPEVEAPARREQRSGSSSQGLSQLLALPQYQLLARWVDAIADTVVVATRNAGAVFGPQPPEVKLGAPESAR